MQLHLIHQTKMAHLSYLAPINWQNHIIMRYWFLFTANTNSDSYSSSMTINIIPYYGLFLCDIQVSDLWIEINQASGDQAVTRATHYDITMGNGIARHAHCDITIGNDVTGNIHCDVTMNNDIAMCIYHGITMHNGIDLNLYFYYVLLCLFMLFYYG